MPLVDSVGFDFDKIKPSKPYRTLPFFWVLVKNLGLIFVFSAVIFFSINLPAYFMIYRYRLNPDQFVDHTRQSDLVAPNVIELGENKLFIPKISVEAPISWNVQGSDVMNQLSNGLVHLAGSSLPDGVGNVFISGHSSNYWWKSGGYNTVFALLPELKEGDDISLTYNGKVYSYKVSQILDLKPNEVQDHMNSDSAELTLMTCIPVGTNLRRLLVVAKPV